MKIDFNQNLNGLDGKPLENPVKFRMNEKGDGLAIGENGQPIVIQKEPIQLATVCINALMSNKQGENVDGVEKVSRYILAMKIRQSNGPIDVTAEEVSKIKILLGEFMGTLIVGSAWEILEGKDK